MRLELRNRGVIHPLDRFIVAKAADLQSALAERGLNEAVIQRFGDQLTIDHVLKSARRTVLGRVFADSQPVEQDSESVLQSARKTAIEWVVKTIIPGHTAWIGHPDQHVLRFGRRMYLELNPDQLSEERIRQLKREWKV